MKTNRTERIGQYRMEPVQVMLATDDTIKASQSQALLDSIQELISLERDVSSAIGSLASDSTSRNVVVPMSPVGFMRATIVGRNVMVGLGQDYFVERTPQQARKILQRRIAGGVCMHSRITGHFCGIGVRRTFKLQTGNCPHPSMYMTERHLSG